MRSFSSLFVIVAILVSAFSPTFAQRGRDSERLSKRPERPERPTPKPAKRTTRFAAVESYSEGIGAYIRWRMDHEQDNVGFHVYRMGRFGGRIVSDIVPGAAVRYGDQPVSDQVYSYFDPSGSIGTAYYVEAIGKGDSSTLSASATTNYVYDVESLDDGGKLKNADLRLTAESTKLEKDLMVDAELNSEIASSVVTPDPNNHRWVVSQPGVRIGVRNGGIIRVPKSDLQNAGFDVNSDPANWQLYMEGVERPIILGPNADYIEFLGKTLDTVESDTRMYYLIVGSGPGRRMRSAVLRPGLTTFASNKYNQSFFMKERTLYFGQFRNGDAENFWGRLFGSAVPSDLLLNLTGVDRTPGNRTLTIQLKGFSTISHNVPISLNGTLLGSVTGFNQQTLTKTFTFPVDLLNEGSNTIRMKTTSGFCIFDNIKIDFPRNFKAEGNKVDFYHDNYRRAAVSGFTTPDIRLFDVTNENDPKLMSNVEIAETNGTWGPVIPSGRGRVYSAIATSVFSAPHSVTPNIPELIGDPSQGGNLVIITHKNFLAEAQTWAAYRTSPTFSVKVVQVDEIYDEFGYGVLSSASVRAFLNYAKNNWSTPPTYVLLLGDASLDPRNYQGYGYWNMVPTEMVDTLFEETGSDDALTDFNNDGLADIAIGRIASRTNAGITTVFNKTVDWEAAVTPDVLNRGALFAYDQNDAQNDFLDISNDVMAHLPASMPKITVRRGDAGATTTILNAFNDTAPVPAESGIYVANYTGHGNSGAWFGDVFFSRTHIPSLLNADRPSLITALTCLNGYFVVPDAAESFAEVLNTADNGGAVAVWASTGQTTSAVQRIMAERFYLKLTEGSITRLGDLANDAKAQLTGGADVKRSWALFGDPMLKVR